MVFTLIPVMPQPALAADPAPRMNNYPIVLIHGLAGWGPDQALGINYWGGVLFDIQKDLKSQGYTSYAVGVGKVSSNWDRACEAYAQIKGGTVDYGAAHAAKYGHSRYGRTYPGYYGQWGNIDPVTGKTYKVHLLGHSMGGQTLRVLIQLLEQGAPEEAAASPNDVSPLFTGGKSWVSGAMSISTPHDGTSADTVVNDGMPWLQSFLGGMSAIMGTNQLYDLMLDQWGVVPQPGESTDTYLHRVYNSAFWTTSKDLANWDLTVEGARWVNGWAKAQPDVYYFSWATAATYKDIFTGHQLPMITMNPMLWPFAGHIGAYTRNRPGEIRIDSSWWRNDGLVPVISADGPGTNTTDTIVSYSGKAQMGKWNYMGIKNGIDHIAICGIIGVWDPRPFFREQAKLLGTLDN